MLTASSPARARTAQAARAVRDVLLGLACVLAVIGFALAALTAQVVGPSMQPTLRDGDLLLVNKFPVDQFPLRRGDIVLLRLGNASAVKRVVGLPGDEFEIDGGQVLLKPGGRGPWRRLSEPYLRGGWAVDAYCCDITGRATSTGFAEALTVPSGRYFVLGDNRDDSDDSRVFGLVPQDWVAGRVLVRYWPLGRAGPVVERPSLGQA